MEKYLTDINDFIDIRIPLSEQNAADLLSTTYDYRPDLELTLLGKMASAVLEEYSLEQVRANSEQVLREVLTCPAAQMVGRGIAQRFKLIEHFKQSADVLDEHEIIILRKAAINDLEPPGFSLPGHLAGYNMASPNNAGRNYKQVIADIEQHMLSSGMAASPKEAVLAVHLLASHAHQDLLVKDIPEDLLYGVSLAWVSFKHGVNLAQISPPGSSGSTTFQSLVELPSSRSAELTTAEDHSDFEHARLEPIMTWATLNGVLRQPDWTPYTSEEMQSVTDALARHQQDSLTALNTLTTEPPDRRLMAQYELTHIKPLPSVTASMEQEAQPAWSGQLHGRLRLVPRHYGNVYLNGLPDGMLSSFHPGTVSVSHRPFDIHAIQRPAHALIDIYMNGENVNDWYKPGLHWKEGSSPLTDSELALFQQLPAVTDLFEERFSQYLSDAKSAYGFLIKRSLTCLSLEHRIAIECGDIQIYTLRIATTGREAGEETEKDKEPLRGRYGFILQTRYADRTDYFEVFPSLVLARHRQDIHELQINGANLTEYWKVSKGPRVAVLVRRGLPVAFDWNAYSTGGHPQEHAQATLIIEALGDSIIGISERPANTGRLPETLFSSRSADIAHRVSTDLFYVNEQMLHERQKGTTSLDREDPLSPLKIIKWVTPWGNIEDLLSGDRDRIRVGAFGLFADAITFMKPVGKIASGVIRLASYSARQIAFRLTLPRPHLIQNLERINGRIGYGLSGRGPMASAQSWSLDKKTAEFKKNLKPSAQAKFDLFQNAIYHEGVTPQLAAARIGAADLKCLQTLKHEGALLGQYQIRLGDAERATFIVDYANRTVRILAVGGHTR